MRRRGRPASQKGPNDLILTFTPNAAKVRSQPLHDILAWRSITASHRHEGAEIGPSLRPAPTEEMREPETL